MTNEAQEFSASARMVPSKLKRVTAELQRVRQSSLARNAGWAFIGRGLDLTLQAAYFILLAHLLGVREYGVFSGALAFASIATPYSALGSGMLFMRYVSAAPEKYSEYWSNILVSTLGIGALLTIILYILAPHFLNPASAFIVLFVSAGSCIFNQLVLCMSQVFQTFEQLHMTAILITLGNLLRLLMVSVMAITSRHATAQQWALYSLVGSVMAAFIGFSIVTSRFGKPHLRLALLKETAAEGIGFSFAGSTQSAYNDLDKAMLSHYGMNLENGIYTIAYRLADVATAPITAMDAAALPRYFRESGRGFAKVRELSNRMVRRAALMGLAMGGCAFLAAPLIPLVLGSGFAKSISAMRWLCLLPAFRGVHQLTGSAITGVGLQRFRTASQCAAATLNLILNLWLIPLHGWLGAAWASLAADGSLGLLNCIVLRRVTSKAHSAERLELPDQVAVRPL